MRFKIDRASLKVGSKFKAFALFYFVFEGNFPSTSPGGLYLEGRFNGGFLRYRFGGLIFGGAYTWRGLFSKFYGILRILSLGLPFSVCRKPDSLLNLSIKQCLTKTKIT